MRTIFLIGLIFGVAVLISTITVGFARIQNPQPVVWATMVNHSRFGDLHDDFTVIHYDPERGISRHILTEKKNKDGSYSLIEAMWTPDGKWLWYVDQAELGYYNIRLVDRFGRREKVLDIVDLYPAINEMSWSPDGEWGLFPQQEEDGNRRLFRIRPDGSDANRLSPEIWLSYDLQIFWSADSQHALLISGTNQNQTDIYHLRRDDWTLRYVASLAGGSIWQVSSPDQTNVAVVVINRRTKHDVYVATIDGSAVELLVGSSPLIHDLHWVNNRRFTAFSSHYLSNRALTLSVDIERRTHFFTSFKELVAGQWTSWSPDGRYFVSYVRPINSGDDRINVTMTADRSQVWQINEIQDCATLNDPFWSPNSRWLMYWDIRDGRCALVRAEHDGSNEMVFWEYDDRFGVLEHLTPPNRNWMVLNTSYPDDFTHHLVDVVTSEHLDLPDGWLIIGWNEMRFESQLNFHIAIIGAIVVVTTLILGVRRTPR